MLLEYEELEYNFVAGYNSVSMKHRLPRKMSFWGKKTRMEWSAGGSIKDSMSILHARGPLVELSRTDFGILIDVERTVFHLGCFGYRAAGT